MSDRRAADEPDNGEFNGILPANNNDASSQSVLDNPRPTSQLEHAAGAERQPLLRPGETCWRIDRASRLAFLVDGEEYFGAVRSALTKARHSFFILGWDIDSKMRLAPQGSNDGFPAQLGEFLKAIVAARRELHGHVLTWDYAMLYALEREWAPIFQFDLKAHRRLAFRLDDRHPVGASHHQKVVVVDDSVAFVSGLDLSRSRWDTSRHACGDPMRIDSSGRAYAPFHDVGAVLSGDSARALGELCRERWRRATGSVPATSRHAAPGDAWPDGVEPVLRDTDVAIARTEPPFGGAPGVAEIRQMHREAIATARKWIFGENQYFTSITIADWLARRLSEPDGPEIALLTPIKQSGWLEASTMGVLRARIHRTLRNADRHDHYRLYCPQLEWTDDSGACLNVHSKVLIVDDEFVTIGSANLADRSLRLDTECNIALEARGDEGVRSAIAGLRERLLAEHLGTGPQQVSAAMARERSLHRAIASLAAPDGRTLAATEPALDPTVDALTPDHGVLDPESPLDPDVLVTELLPEPEGKRGVRTRIAVIVLIVAAFAALALAWRYTPLREWLDIDVLVHYGEMLSDVPLAPLLVAATFVVGSLLMVPVTLMIAATALVFGPLTGALSSLLGATLAASVTYGIGRKMGRDTVRRIAGDRLNTLSQRLGHRGLLTVIIVRMLPIAPFAVVNIVAGASHIGWRDFLLGTVIGLLPGTLLATVFVDRAVAAIRQPGPVAYAVLAGVAAVIVGIGWLLRRKLEHNAKHDNAARTAAAAANVG
jgi:phospholipase D1/2